MPPRPQILPERFDRGADLSDEARTNRGLRRCGSDVGRIDGRWGISELSGLSHVGTRTSIRAVVHSHVSGWLIPGRPRAGVVLLLHGVRADRREMLGRARFLNRLGYGHFADRSAGTRREPGRSHHLRRPRSEGRAGRTGLFGAQSTRRAGGRDRRFARRRIIAPRQAGPGAERRGARIDVSDH